MGLHAYVLSQGTILQGNVQKYQIERVIGKGSFGITYLATVINDGAADKDGIDKKVAIKEFFMRHFCGRRNSLVTKAANNRQFQKYKLSFIQEAQKLSQIKHHSIVKVIELFEANNTAYYAMKYIEGGSLDEYIRKRQALSEVETVLITRQICEALKYMHFKHFLHLDLKPKNVMMRSNGDIVLIDPGVFIHVKDQSVYSKGQQKESLPKPTRDASSPNHSFIDESTTNPLMDIDKGTPGYAPLEQFCYTTRMGEFPATIDIYALGATIYKMLTGCTPPDALYVLNNGIPEKMLQGVAEELKECVVKAMMPKVSDRYQTIAELLSSLPSPQNLNAEKNTPEKPYLMRLDKPTPVTTLQHRYRLVKIDTSASAIIIVFFRGFRSIPCGVTISKNMVEYESPYNIDETPLYYHSNMMPCKKQHEITHKEYKDFIEAFNNLHLVMREHEIPNGIDASEPAESLLIRILNGRKTVMNLWVGGWECQFGNLIGNTRRLKEQIKEIIPQVDYLPQELKYM